MCRHCHKSTLQGYDDERPFPNKVDCAIVEYECLTEFSFAFARVFVVTVG